MLLPWWGNCRPSSHRGTGRLEPTKTDRFGHTIAHGVHHTTNPTKDTMKIGLQNHEAFVLTGWQSAIAAHAKPSDPA